MSSEEQGDRLPFEPRKTKKKTPKAPPTEVKTSPKSRQTAKNNASLSAIPDAVSKRMIRRMAVFSATPTALGMSSFVIFYILVTKDIFEVPSIAVLLVSLGFFGLGVLGLSYGILSTSWDEERVGSLLGGEEFSLNVGRMVEAWRTARRDAQSNKT